MIDKLQARYGFTRMPFGRDLAPGMLHRHAAHNEACARITWCIAERVLAAVQGGRHRAGCVVAGERGFGDGSGCGRVVCDGTVSVSDKGRPSPLPFPEARGGP